MGEPNVSLLYSEWKRLHCEPREMVRLCRQPKWKKVLSTPWLWWSHFMVARRHATVFQAARLATLFVWAFLTVGGASKRIGELPVKVWTKEPPEVT
jgi:hypothetical protein